MGRSASCCSSFRGIHYDRVLENILRALLERGHEIHVALAGGEAGLGGTRRSCSTALPSSTRSRTSSSSRGATAGSSPRLRYVTGIDYLRYLEPEYKGADPLRDRARGRTRRVMRVRGPVGRRLVGPPARRIEAAVHGSEGDHRADRAAPARCRGRVAVRRAQARRGRLHPRRASARDPDRARGRELGQPHEQGRHPRPPSMTVVWNGAQIAEAVDSTAYRGSASSPSGAHSFDHWFAWQPGRSARSSREVARSRAPDRALRRVVVLHLRGRDGIRRGVARRVRAHPRLRERPVSSGRTPERGRLGRLDVDEHGKTVSGHARARRPPRERQKIDYYESLYHSRAMFGINTSALIEAAIVQSPGPDVVSDHPRHRRHPPFRVHRARRKR